MTRGDNDDYEMAFYEITESLEVLHFYDSERAV